TLSHGPGPPAPPGRAARPGTPSPPRRGATPRADRGKAPPFSTVTAGNRVTPPRVRTGSTTVPAGLAAARSPARAAAPVTPARRRGRGHPAACADQRQTGVAGLGAGRLAVQRGRAVHLGAPHLRDPAPATQARLAGRGAVDAGDQHAVAALQAELLAGVGIQR